METSKSAATKSPRFKRAFEQIAAEIREKIATGKLATGDRLERERDLAERFQVSRHTVREAIRSLENSGLLMLKRGPGGGAFIASGDGSVVRNGMTDLISLGIIDPDNLREAQMIICVAVARLAAKRRSDADMEAIRGNVRATAAAVREEDVEARVQLNYDFHRLLAKATGNPALEVLTNAVLELNDSLGKVAGLRRPSLAMNFRKRILVHLQKQDAAASAAEMERHLETLRKFYHSRLEARSSR